MFFFLFVLHRLQQMLLSEDVCLRIPYLLFLHHLQRLLVQDWVFFRATAG